MSAIVDSFAVSTIARYSVSGFNPYELTMTDVNYSYFDLLLLFNNLNVGTTTFTDSSSKARNISKTGSPLLLKKYISDGILVQNKTQMTTI